MTLIIVIKNPAGSVLAADSAGTIVEFDNRGREASRVPSPSKAIKILAFEKPHNFAAAVAYGRGAIDKKTPNDYRSEFEMKLPQERLPVKKLTEELCRFFLEKWNESADKNGYRPELEVEKMRFCVGGFDKNKLYGCVYELSIPDAPEPREISTGDDATFSYIAGWRPLSVDLRLVKETGRIKTMPLREIEDLAKSCIQNVINEQGEDEKGNKIVDGPVIGCTITARDGSNCFNMGL